MLFLVKSFAYAWYYLITHTALLYQIHASKHDIIILHFILFYLILVLCFLTGANVPACLISNYVVSASSKMDGGNSSMLPGANSTSGMYMTDSGMYGNMTLSSSNFTLTNISVSNGDIMAVAAGQVRAQRSITSYIDLVSRCFSSTSAQHVFQVTSDSLDCVCASVTRTVSIPALFTVKLVSYLLVVDPST